MSTTNPSMQHATRRPPSGRGSKRPNVIPPLTGGLAVFVVLSAVALVVALLAGATLVFNVAVWLLFAVLWLALMAAIALAPATVDELWGSLRQRPLAIQALIWLLFLPIMIGVWIWRRPWAPLIRLTLLVALGAWNLFLFFPR